MAHKTRVSILGEDELERRQLESIFQENRALESLHNRTIAITH